MRCATAIPESPQRSSGWPTEGCTRILAAPLYPQYCAATTATANDAVFGVLARMRWQPAMRTLPPYYDDPLYIEALAANLSRQLAALDFEPERLLLSFHGMPHADARARRSLSLPLPEDGAAARRSARARRRRRVPVEVRPREVAGARDRRDARRLSEEGRQARRRRRAGLFGRLHRNPGRARHPRPPDRSSAPAASSSRCSTASTIRPKASPCWNG